MTRMPQVRREIAYSMYRSIDSLDAMEDKSEYLNGFWKEFKKEQPELHAIVLKELTSFKSKEQMGAFAHGIWLLWSALKSQQEADEMNESWGI